MVRVTEVMNTELMKRDLEDAMQMLLNTVKPIKDTVVRLSLMDDKIEGRRRLLAYYDSADRDLLKLRNKIHHHQCVSRYENQRMGGNPPLHPDCTRWRQHGTFQMALFMWTPFYLNLLMEIARLETDPHLKAEAQSKLVREAAMESTLIME